MQVLLFCEFVQPSIVVISNDFLSCFPLRITLYELSILFVVV